jgi:uncharacterized protein
VERLLVHYETARTIRVAMEGNGSYPRRFLLCGSFDPREEEAGIDPFRRMVAEYPIGGLKLYTAEWRNGSRGWRLNDSWAYKYLSLAQAPTLRRGAARK